MGNITILAFAILAISLVLIIKEYIPLGGIGLLIPVVFVLAGISTPKEMISYFGNDTVILVACSYPLSAAILDVGIANTIGSGIQNFSKRFKNSERAVMLLIMISVVFVNTMISRTPTVAALMPIVISIAISTGVSRTRLLFILVMTANFGGFTSLMSTPSNTMANAFLAEKGFPVFSYFEFAWVGIPLAIGGTIVFLLLDKWIIPSRVVETAPQQGAAAIDVLQVPKWKVVTTYAVFVMFVLGVMFGRKMGLSNAIVGLAAVGILIAARVIGEKRAFQSIGWSMVFFIVGILALGGGLEAAGANQVIADIALKLLGSQPSPYLVTAVLFGVGAIATQFMNNTGAAGVLFPIALTVAASVGADPRAAIMAVAFGCGSSFMTPMATPANAMVMEAGEIKFGDFVKAGFPLMAVTAVIVILLVPRIWPFY